MFTNDVAGLPYTPPKISPKPAIPMLRAAIDQIGTARGIGKLDYLGADVWGYAFQDEPSGQLRAAIWDASGGNRTVSLDTGKPRVEIADAFGNREERATKDGFVTLQLSRAPVYLRGVADALFAPAKTANYLARVSRPENHANAARAQCEKRCVDRAARCSHVARARQYKGRSRRKSISKSRPTRRWEFPPLRCACAVSNGTIEQSLQRIEVVPELQISAPQLRNVGANWTLEAQVKNVAPARWSGNADLNFQNAIQNSAAATGAESTDDDSFSARRARDGDAENSG